MPPADHDREERLEATRTAENGESFGDGAMVTVISGASKGTSLAIPSDVGASLRVGKAKDNDLVLGDDTVSRYHLAIGRTDRGLEVRDLGSTNGVRIGGARVESALVEPGTIVRVGEVELLVRVEAVGPQIAPSPEPRFGEAIGHGLPMRRIFGVLQRVARTNATVLLMGETGTGKDVLARSIHAESDRARGPFEVVDCGAIAPTLIESELFGHERGAFTGASSARAGAFERASGGTLFLDELGELPLDLQPKLLRVLEARSFRRVGGQKTLDADVRVIAATTKDLPREVRRGLFREDLWFRLAVVPLLIPPLRDRLDDLPALAERILAGSRETLADENDHERLRLAPEALGQLRAHDWPGNVRELRNVLERAALLARASGDAVIRAVEIEPPEIAGDASEVFRFRAGMTWREAKARVDSLLERRYLAWLLERHGNNASAAAREAQLDRKYLAEMARRHGLLDRK
ncbi:MAG: sigma 54-dependent Fis family transcriptional regulator [Deltaproteobacteria bacterium]|nr:sigma 54-dependent Fis family transcriptional regulator [Deltaproteobacteria bacterium]